MNPTFMEEKLQITEVNFRILEPFNNVIFVTRLDLDPTLEATY